MLCICLLISAIHTLVKHVLPIKAGNKNYVISYQEKELQKIEDRVFLNALIHLLFKNANLGYKTEFNIIFVFILPHHTFPRHYRRHSRTKNK